VLVVVARIISGISGAGEVVVVVVAAVVVVVVVFVFVVVVVVLEQPAKATSSMTTKTIAMRDKWPLVILGNIISASFYVEKDLTQYIHNN
jgi:uncharacterized membrane protein